MFIESTIFCHKRSVEGFLPKIKISKEKEETNWKWLLVLFIQMVVNTILEKRAHENLDIDIITNEVTWSKNNK